VCYNRQEKLKKHENFRGDYMNWQELEKRIAAYEAKGVEVPTKNLIKTPEQLEGIRKASALNTAVLDEVEKQIKAGMSTEDINTIVYDYTTAHGGIPAPLNYEGFPKSVCTSVNEEVCHGIPDKKVILKSGDIVNVDATTIYHGYYGDASRMFMIGRVTPARKNLVGITRECMRRGIAAAKGWSRVGDIGAVIAAYAHKHGYSVVREFGGHGVGLDMHEEPFVCHISKKNTGMLLVPGMVITVEPMINMGKPDLYIDAENNWTAVTEDGKASAQWENTILITEGEPEILSW
jgi:methionyl aminopeptidase